MMEGSQLPEGMELSLLFYATSATAPDAHDGLNAVITLGGKTTTSGVDAKSLASAPLSEALDGLSESMGGTWRAMTRSEIAAYKEDEDE